jgi:5-deoxy-glucuronate isomerase
MGYTAKDLLHRSRLGPGESGLVNRVTPVEAGWEHLSVEIRRFRNGERWSADTGDAEGVVVLLGGRCSVTSNRGNWSEIGRRKNVFDGMPWALYLPRHTTFEVQALGDDLEIAYAWVPTDQDRSIQLVTPDDVQIDIRGGHNNTRQINNIVPPGWDCHRIVCVEVYTPSGNWSSYPPHKHDTHRVSGDTLLEADLEEFYCYKFARPGGWAMQRIYTDDRSIDSAVVAQDGDVVLVPEGYHPVCTGYGYDCYYLNFLAGSAQSLAATDDPEHAWVKDTWTATDPRVPMVTREMEAGRAKRADDR